MSNIVDKVFDNSADNEGKPNYAIQLVDGTRLYCRGEILNPLPKSGDAIDFTVINVKTSSKGNPYTNVKNVKIADNHTLDDDLPTDTYVPEQQSRPMPVSNGMNKNDTQRMDIFVTGVVGRSMGSGHFSVEDISDLTKNAVRAFNDNLKDI
jgi:hypothetical protein|tara:strand:+ start:83 stop:535 length:453 start_codon:yes stop_codon:yes gene_type:complete